VNGATAMVSLAGLGVRYGAVTALRGVDLRVNRGDFIALVGANGSGKTTLLQALHGMVAHTGSRVVSELAAAQVCVRGRDGEQAEDGEEGVEVDGEVVARCKAVVGGAFRCCRGTRPRRARR